MGDTETLLLNLANIALGVVVLVCLLGAMGAIVYEIAVRVSRRIRISAELDRYVSRLGGAYTTPK